ncbi:MAG TPA: sugar ABC transporter permease [Aggregatilineales bacterium]|nr:sugar ABC transporter permease [Aggregatilineales bacterium]
MIEKQRKSLTNGPIVGGAAASAAAPGAPRVLGWKQQHQLIGLVFLLPAVVFVAIFYVYPIVLNIVISLERYTAKSFVTGEAPFIGFDNFIRLFGNPDFTVALQNTFLFTLNSLIFQFVIGLALALFFNQRFPLSRLLRSLFLLPWLAPILVSGAIWVRLFDLDYGVINFVLRSLGLIQQPLAWLTDPHLALVSVLIANIWIGIPFNMVILYGGLQNIPNTLYEAAMLDGANAWQKFRYVSWPLLRPVSTVVLLLGLIYTLKVFDVIMSITRGGPANVSQTLNTWAYSLSFTSFDFGLGAAAGDILMLVVLVFGLIYLRYAAREGR